MKESRYEAIMASLILFLNSFQVSVEVTGVNLMPWSSLPISLSLCFFNCLSVNLSGFTSSPSSPWSPEGPAGDRLVRVGTASTDDIVLMRVCVEVKWEVACVDPNETVV